MFPRERYKVTVSCICEGRMIERRVSQAECRSIISRASALNGYSQSIASKCFQSWLPLQTCIWASQVVTCKTVVALTLPLMLGNKGFVLILICPVYREASDQVTKPLLLARVPAELVSTGGL
jgi:hypothetical protein